MPHQNNRLSMNQQCSYYYIIYWYNNNYLRKQEWQVKLSVFYSTLLSGNNKEKIKISKKQFLLDLTYSLIVGRRNKNNV